MPKVQQGTIAAPTSGLLYLLVFMINHELLSINFW